MDGKSEGVHGHVAHQLSKSKLEQDVSVNTTPEAPAWAVTRGSAKRRPLGGPPAYAK